MHGAQAPSTNVKTVLSSELARRRYRCTKHITPLENPRLRGADKHPAKAGLTNRGSLAASVVQSKEGGRARRLGPNYRIFIRSRCSMCHPCECHCNNTDKHNSIHIFHLLVCEIHILANCHTEGAAVKAPTAHRTTPSSYVRSNCVTPNFQTMQGYYPDHDGKRAVSEKSFFHGEIYRNRETCEAIT